MVGLLYILNLNLFAFLLWLVLGSLLCYLFCFQCMVFMCWCNLSTCHLFPLCTNSMSSTYQYQYAMYAYFCLFVFRIYSCSRWIMNISDNIPAMDNPIERQSVCVKYILLHVKQFSLVISLIMLMVLFMLYCYLLTFVLISLYDFINGDVGVQIGYVKLSQCRVVGIYVLYATGL